MRSASIAQTPTNLELTLSANDAQRRLWVEGISPDNATPGYVKRINMALRLHLESKRDFDAQRRERHAETPEVTVNFELGNCGQSDSTS